MPRTLAERLTSQIPYAANAEIWRPVRSFSPPVPRDSAEQPACISCLAITARKRTASLNRWSKPSFARLTMRVDQSLPSAIEGNAYSRGVEGEASQSALRNSAYSGRRRSPRTAAIRAGAAAATQMKAGRRGSTRRTSNATCSLSPTEVDPAYGSGLLSGGCPPQAGGAPSASAASLETANRASIG